MDGSGVLTARAISIPKAKRLLNARRCGRIAASAKSAVSGPGGSGGSGGSCIAPDPQHNPGRTNPDRDPRRPDKKQGKGPGPGRGGTNKKVLRGIPANDLLVVWWYSTSNPSNPSKPMKGKFGDHLKS